MVATRGHPACLKALAELGADLEARGKSDMTALIYAASNGEVDCVKALIDAGANLEAADSWKMTALRRAAEAGKLDCVEALVAAGADVGALNTVGGSAGTALMAYGLKEEVARALIKYGADVNARNRGGQTALAWQLERGCDLGVVRALIDGGADLDAVDNDGRLPVSYCRSDEARRLLQKAGKKALLCFEQEVDGRYLIKKGQSKDGHGTWSVCFDKKTGACTATRESGLRSTGMALYEISRDVYDRAGDPAADTYGEIGTEGREIYRHVLNDPNEYTGNGTYDVVLDEKCWELGRWAGVFRPEPVGEGRK